VFCRFILVSALFTFGILNHAFGENTNVWNKGGAAATSDFNAAANWTNSFAPTTPTTTATILVTNTPTGLQTITNSLATQTIGNLVMSNNAGSGLGFLMILSSQVFNVTGTTLLGSNGTIQIGSTGFGASAATFSNNNLYMNSGTISFSATNGAGTRNQLLVNGVFTNTTKSIIQNLNGSGVLLTFLNGSNIVTNQGTMTFASTTKAYGVPATWLTLQVGSAAGLNTFYNSGTFVINENLTLVGATATFSNQFVNAGLFSNIVATAGSGGTTNIFVGITGTALTNTTTGTFKLYENLASSWSLNKLVNGGFVNNGTLNMEATATTQSNIINLADGSTFSNAPGGKVIVTNVGIAYIQANGIVNAGTNLLSGGTLVYQSSSGGNGILQNSGTVLYNGGLLNVSVLTNTSSGVISNIQAGGTMIWLANTTNYNFGVIATGSGVLTNFGFLNLNGGSASQLSGIFSNAGTGIIVVTNGTTALSGTFLNNGNLNFFYDGTLTNGIITNMVSGVINFVSGGSISNGVSAPLVNLSGGILNATNGWDIIAGGVTNAAGATININNAGTLVAGGASGILTNAGTITAVGAGGGNVSNLIVNLSGGTINATNGWVNLFGGVTNAAGATINLRSAGTLTGGTITNAGTINAVAGGNVSNLIANLSGGTLNATSGWVNLFGGVTNTGVIRLNNTSTLTGGTITNAGNIYTFGVGGGYVSNAIVNLNGGAINATNGTLTLRGYVSGAGAYVAANNSTLVFAGGGAVDFSQATFITNTFVVTGGQALTNSQAGDANIVGTLIITNGTLVNSAYGNFNIGSALNTTGTLSIANLGYLSVTNGGSAQLIVGQSGLGTLTLNSNANLSVDQLLVTNNVLGGVTNSVFNFTSGTLTTSNAVSAVAANIAIASNNMFIINGTWNMLGGTNLMYSTWTNNLSSTLANVIIGSNANNAVVNVGSGATWLLGTSSVSELNIFVGRDNGSASNSLNIGGVGASALVSNVGNLIIGSGATHGSRSNQVTVTNGTLAVGLGITVGGGAGALSNSLIVLGNGTVNMQGTSLSIGAGTSTGNVVMVDGGGVAGGAVITNASSLAIGNGNGDIGNRLVVTNGGKLVVTGELDIGSGAGVISNFFKIDGGSVGSTVSIGGALKVGTGTPNSFNQMLVTNATLLTGGQVYVGGSSGTSNSLTVLGNTTWDLQANTLYFGNGSSTGNTLTVDGGGVVGGTTIKNVTTIEIGHGINDVRNSLSISNGANLFSGDVKVGAGAGASNNAYNVGGGVALTTVTNGSITVGSINAGFNQMTVTNANIWSKGLTIGSGSSNNTVTVKAGTTWNLSSNLTVGTGSTTGNVLNISGGTVNTTNLTISATASDTGNSISIAGGSLVVTNAGLAGNLIIGQAGSGSVTVTNGGTILANQITLGQSVGSAGTLTINNLGTVVETNTAFVIGTGGAGIVSLNNGGMLVVSNGPFVIGQTSAGTLTMNSGSTLSNVTYGATNALGSLILGQNSNGTGTFTLAASFAVTNAGAGQLIVGQSSRGTLTLNSNANLRVDQLLVTNNISGGVTNSFFNFNAGSTLTTSNGLNQLAADIVIASNGTFNINGTWNMLGGTNIISGLSSSSAGPGNVIIGSNVINAAVIVANGAIWSLNAPGSTYSNLVLTVGYGTGGSNNSLAINGGTVTNVGGLLVGATGGANFNSLIVTGAGSGFFINSGGINVGGNIGTGGNQATRGGSDNTVILSNSFITTTTVSTIGSNSCDNTLTLLSSVWDLNNNELHIGTLQAGSGAFHGSNNIVNVFSGAVISNGAVYVGTTNGGSSVNVISGWNSLIVSNGGLAVLNGLSVGAFPTGTGYAGASNNFAYVSNITVTAASQISKGFIVVGDGGGVTNKAILDNVQWNGNNGTMDVGSGASQNQSNLRNSLAVQGGSILTNFFQIAVGNNRTAVYTAMENSLVVTGSNTLLTTSGNVIVGGAHGGALTGGGAVSNSIQVLSGASVLSTNIFIGFLGALGNDSSVTATTGVTSANFILVDGAGSAWTNQGDAYVGYSSIGYTANTNINNVQVSQTMTSSNNLLVIANGSTFWTTNLVVGLATGGYGVNSVGTNFVGNNQVIVSNGASLFTKDLTIGVTNQAGSAMLYSTGNSVLLTNATLVATGALTVGANGIGNQFIIGGSSTATVSQLIVNDGNMVGFLGGVLNSAGTFVTNTSAFTIGDGTQSAAFNLRGGTHAFSNGVVVANNGTISGWGTVAAAVFSTNQTGGTITATNGTLLLSSGFAGSGSFRAESSGVLNLAVSNTYSGLTIVNGGQVVIADPNAVQNSTVSNITADAGITFTVNSANFGGLAGMGNFGLTNDTAGVVLSVGANNANSAYSGALSGNGSLTKVGSGELLLSGNSSYNGGTTISNGWLALGNNNALGSGGLTFAGGTLTTTGNMVVTNTMTLASDGTIDTAGNNLSISGVIGGVNDLVKTGNGKLTLLASNTYYGATIINQGTVVVAQSGGLANSTVTPNVNGGLQFSNDTNFVVGGLAGTGNVSLANVAGAAVGLTVGNNGGITSYGGVLSGDGSLTLVGGTLNLTNANSYAGGTVINGGTLKANNSSGSGLGTGAVIVNSGGTLGGTGTVSGLVTVNSGGILSPGNSPGVQQLGALTLNAGSILNFQFQTNAPFANDQIIVTSVNGLTINGAGFNLLTENGGTNPNDPTQKFTTEGSYSLLQYSGALQGVGIAGLTVLNGANNRTYAFGDSNSWVTLTIGGEGIGWMGTAGLPAGPWNWSNAGNWVSAVSTGSLLIFDGNTGVNNNNDFAANTWFSGLLFTNTAGAFALGGNAINLRGDVVNLSPATQTINLPVVLESGSRIFNAASGAIVVNGVVSEASAGLGIIKTGGQTLVLTGSNTYTGVTEIQGGALRVTDGIGLPTGSNLKLNGGVLESSGTFTRILGTTPGAVQWDGSGGFSAYGGVLTVNINNNGSTLTWGGTANFVASGNALKFGSSSADNMVKFINPLDLNGAVQTINVDGAAAIGVDFTGAISGTGNSGLIKTGAGTMRMSANSSYSGTTTINGGTLLLAAKLTSDGGMFVNSGGTVGGTGIFYNTLTLASGGILSPGDHGAGLLTVSSLNLSNGFVYDWELGMTATDRVDVTTADGLSYFGSNWTLNLSTEAGVSALAQWQGIDMTNDVFVLFQLGSGSAPFGLTNDVTIIGGGGWNASQARVSVVGNKVLLSGVYFNNVIEAIPEPNVLLMWLAGAVTVLFARRRHKSRLVR